MSDTELNASVMLIRISTFFVCYLYIKSATCESVILKDNKKESLHYTDSHEWITAQDLVFCTKETYNKTCCKVNEFQCDNGVCIPKEKLCNMSPTPYKGMVTTWRLVLNPHMASSYECSDWSDEIGCERQTCNSRTTKCPQLCVDLPENKSRCTCYKGFVMKVDSFKPDNVLCVDIDECEIGVHWCDQNCINLNGTFRCSCSEGFEANKLDQRGSCKATNGNKLVLFNSEHWIYAYDVEKRQKTKVVAADNLEGMDYETINDILYWFTGKWTARSYIPGVNEVNATVGQAQVLDTPNFRENVVRNSLCIDWIAENMYWLSSDIIDSAIIKIMVSKLDGRYTKTVINNISEATSLAINPEKGWMYWAVAGENARIDEAWMDGYIRKRLLTLTGQHPIALTLDHKSQGRLYWTDSKTNIIYSSNEDGSRHFHVISLSSAHSPLSMDVFESYLYWITKETNQLVRVDKFGRKQMEILVENLVNQTSMKIYHKRKVDKEIRKGKHQIICNGQCTHLCVHIPGSYMCHCPDGFKKIYNMGDVTCDAPIEPQYPYPLVCNCKDKENVCNTSSPYVQCNCERHILCDLNTIEKSTKPNPAYVFKIIIATIVFITFFILFALSLYKYTLK